MPEDLGALLTRLIQSGTIETASVTVVLKPVTDPLPPPDSPVCVFTIGPVSSKE